MRSGFESVLTSISLELLSPDCQLHRRMDVPTPVKIDRLFSKHPNPDQFSVVQRGIPSSVWSQPVNQGLIGSFQPLVRPWLSPRWVGWEARKRSKTSVFFSLALLIIDYRLGSRIHFASQQSPQERFGDLEIKNLRQKLKWNFYIQEQHEDMLESKSMNDTITSVYL